MLAIIRMMRSFLKGIIHPPYDMYGAKAEQFYSRLYLEFIDQFLKGKSKLRILDAGCGAGRICIPLAADGYECTGVDYDKNLIAKAQKYAAKNGVKVDFHQMDIVEYLKTCPAESFDCVLCLELLYILECYQEVYCQLLRVLKREGVFIISVKPKPYYVLYYLTRGKFKEAELVAKNESALIGKRHLNWQTADQVVKKLGDLGVKDISLYGLGIVSGTGPDPQAKCCDPAKLNDDALQLLFEIEKQLALNYPDSGRYILAIGVKGHD